MNFAPAILATGLLTTLGLVVGTAGARKLRRPGPAARALAALGAPTRPALARGLGLVEIGVGLLALTAPAALAGAALTGMFAAFAAATHRLRPRAGQPSVGCGCFGADTDRPPGPAQVAANALAAVAAGLGAASSARALPAVWVASPARGAIVVGAAGAGAALWSVAVNRRLPAARAGRLGERIVESSAGFLERRISRRSALLRFALAGSAFCVAPLRYLLYPGTALGVIVPSSCSTGDCTDGYTAFCCEINQGVNACPTGTFPGGWWKCTDYPGRNLCADQGVRYYVDCNRIPGQAFPGGCRCANDSCASRRINCNVFRYGQCNTHVGHVTEVVCRVVTCQNPGTIPSLNCSSSIKIDNAVCGHDAGCLEYAVQLVGAGGV